MRYHLTTSPQLLKHKTHFGDPLFVFPGIEALLQRGDYFVHALMNEPLGFENFSVDLLKFVVP